METKDLLPRIKRALDKATARIEELENKLREPIAVIGMAGRFPGAQTPEELWQLLKNGTDCITEIPPERWSLTDHYDPEMGVPNKSYVREGAFLSRNVAEFDAAFFGISPREAMHMDPQQRMLLEVAWEAIERGGLAPASLKNSRTGVFVGISPSEYTSILPEPTRLDTYATTGNSAIFASGRLSYVLGLQGPSLVVDTACSASLIAVHLACESLRGGGCNLALAGGVHLMISPQGHILQSQLQSLAPDGRCKTFDAAANGYGRGEGCGIVVLKRLSDALADKDPILAIIRGTATNHDGPSNGLTVPSVTAQSELIRQALENGKVPPDAVSYIEAHGTGTALGDPIEVRALSTVFGTRKEPLWIGSIKTNLGHLEEAAGVTGLIKVILSLQHAEIPPHLHFRHPNPHIDWEQSPFRVPTGNVPWQASRKIAGISSFGLGGSNAHVVVEQAPAISSAELSPHSELFVVSAKSAGALRALAGKYHEFLADSPTTRLADLCFTAATGRNHFAHRLALVADTCEELQKQLAQYIDDPTSGAVKHGVAALHEAAPRVAFLFTGQGSQYPGMGRELYQSTDPAVLPFRKVLDRCDPIFREQFGRSLFDVTHPPDDSTNDELMRSHPIGQAVNFALECALAELWSSWGIRPAAVLGHSLGDFAAACFAGAFSLEDGLRLVITRGRLMEKAVGSMVSALASEADIEPFLRSFSEVSIAAINGPSSIVLSGAHESIERLTSQLQAAGIKTRRMDIPVAAHSALLDPVLESFAAAVRDVVLSKPRLPVVSSMTGRLVTNELTDPEYWKQQLRNPVRFAQGVETLRNQAISTFLEIGPKPTLVGMANQILTESKYSFLPSLREGQSDWQQMLGSLGDLYVRGIEPDWRALHTRGELRKIIVPTYAFDRQRHWVDQPRKKAERAELCYHLTWREGQIHAHSRLENETKPWLVFAGRGEHGHALVRRLELRGQKAIVFESTEEVRGILRQYPSPRGVVFLGTTIALNDDPLEVAVRHCASLQGLVQALSACSSSPRLWVVTRDAQAVTTRDRCAGIVQAPLWGLGRVLRVEHPELRCQCVDLDGSADDEAQADALVTELSLDDEESLVAWRNGRRHVARLSRYRLEPTTQRIRADATYLITGGLGTLGLIVAEGLVNKGARRVVLLGRSAPNSQALARIQALEARGATMTVVQADVTNRAQLAEVLAHIDPHAPLAGIVHAVADRDAGGLLLQQSAEKLRQGLSAKVAGAWNLHTLTESGPPLDFFVFFSSMTTTFGDIGLSAYIAANAFLDALAHLRRAEGKTALAIDWGIWSEVGEAAALSKSHLFAQGHERIAAARGLTILEELLGQPAARVIVAPLDWNRFQDRQESREPLFAEFVTSVEQPSAVADLKPVDIRQRFANAPAAQRKALITEHVASRVAQLLRLTSAAVDPRENLLSLGFDSLMAVELRNLLRQTWRVDISFARFLQGISVHEVVDTLWRELDGSEQPTPAHQESEHDESDWVTGAL